MIRAYTINTKVAPSSNPASSTPHIQLLSLSQFAVQQTFNGYFDDKNYSTEQEISKTSKIIHFRCHFARLPG